MSIKRTRFMPAVVEPGYVYELGDTFIFGYNGTGGYEIITIQINTWHYVIRAVLGDALKTTIRTTFGLRSANNVSQVQAIVKGGAADGTTRSTTSSTYTTYDEDLDFSAATEYSLLVHTAGANDNGRVEKFGVKGGSDHLADIYEISRIG